MSEDFDIGKLIFGDHKCCRCERVVQDYEEHIHVPMNDYITQELGEDGIPGEIGEEATLIFCSKCIQHAEEGYAGEAHKVDVPEPNPLLEESA